MRAPRRAKAEQPEAEKSTRYWLTDTNAREVNGRRLTDAELKDGFLLTDAEAAHYIASGSVTEENPKDSAAAKEAVKKRTQGGAVGGIGGGSTAGNPATRSDAEKADDKGSKV